MTQQEKINKGIDQLQKAIENLSKISGPDKFNFIASLTIFDKDDNLIDDTCIFWNIGYIETCKVSAEALLEEIKNDEEDLTYNFNHNLN